MDEDISRELSDHLVISNKKLNMLIGEMKDKYPEEVYKPYLEKLAHIIALNFDVLDKIGEEHPHLNPYDNSNEH